MLASEMPGLVVVGPPPAGVVLPPPAPAALVAVPAAVVAAPVLLDDAPDGVALLSLPHEASAVKAAVATSTGASRRRMTFTGPPGSCGCVLRTVPTQRHVLDHSDEHDRRAAHE